MIPEKSFSIEKYSDYRELAREWQFSCQKSFRNSTFFPFLPFQLGARMDVHGMASVPSKTANTTATASRGGPGRIARCPSRWSATTEWTTTKVRTAFCAEINQIVNWQIAADGLIDCSDSECCSHSVCSEHIMCLSSNEPVDVLLRKQPPSVTASFFQRVKFLIEENSVQSYAHTGEYAERWILAKFRTHSLQF